MKPLLRIVHNLARTGGTIISRCLACMPGVVLLSEIHEFGRDLVDPQIGFAPLNAIRQAKEWYGIDVPPGDSAAADVCAVEAECQKRGLLLVVRAWDHVDFMPSQFNREPTRRSSIVEQLATTHQIKRIAIGACLASGGRRTVCIEGDGGFAMNVQELEVVRRLGLPIKFFVLDNGGYGSIRQTQTTYFGGRFVASDPGSGLTLPGYQRVAAAFGIESCVLRDHEGIRDRVQRILDRDGPMVCVVKVSPSQRTEPRLVSGQRKDGSMYSKPLEDLWPFLDREEFRANMIVPPVEEDE